LQVSLSIMGIPRRVYLNAGVLVAYCAAASSCSYSFLITATLAEGRIVFQSKDDADHPPWCLELRVRGEDGVVVWAFERPYSETAAKCGPNFPLFYGDLPSGAVLKVAPKPIVRGKLYSIKGNGGGDLSGYFRLSADGRSIENVKSESVNVDVIDADQRIAMDQMLEAPANETRSSEPKTN